MKKIIIISVLLFTSCLFFTGCSKKYKTVVEYANAMAEIKKAHSSYLFEGNIKVTNNGIAQDIPTFKYYINNGISKIEFYNNDSQRIQTRYFDGKEVVAHSQDQDMLLILFTEKMLNSMPEDRRTLLLNIMTFGGLLYNWDSPTGSKTTNNACPLYKAKFVKNTKMNGYQCRLISFGKEDNDFYSESCVNDELGVAVYTKLKTENGLAILNADSIETNTVSVDDVKLPSYLEKYTMSELLTKMGKAFSKMDILN